MFPFRPIPVTQQAAFLRRQQQQRQLLQDQLQQQVNAGGRAGFLQTADHLNPQAHGVAGSLLNFLFLFVYFFIIVIIIYIK
jgi:hypothetical protein